MKLRLTQRQREIVDGLVRGLDAVQIADELDIQPSTVEGHIARIKERWDCASVADIVAMAAAQ